jgi:adenylate cyclase
VFVIGMTIFVTRSITRPLAHLQQAMERVELNDFDASVPVSTNDELGYLGERFNQMNAGLRQGDLMRNLLNLYVSPEVAREALAKGARLGGALAECSVLFSDMRDFTGLSERLTPNDLIAFINRYMTMMVTLVTEQGGMINKFGGDSLLAIFGTPLNPADDHAARAVRTALAMRDRLIQFNDEQARAGAPIIRIGIGIATGSVVAGNVGSAERIEYTVLGDTVNLAARLEQKTKELGCDILLSETTCNAAREKITFKAELLTGVAVRGKNETVAVYALK